MSIENILIIIFVTFIIYIYKIIWEKWIALWQHYDIKNRIFNFWQNLYVHCLSCVIRYDDVNNESFWQQENKKFETISLTF